MFEVVCQDDVLAGLHFSDLVSYLKSRIAVQEKRFIMLVFSSKDMHIRQKQHSSTHHKLYRSIPYDSLFQWKLFSAFSYGRRAWNEPTFKSSEKLRRDVLIRPSGESKIHSDQLLRLLKHLYGLFDARYYWNSTLYTHRQHDLGMSRSTDDVSLFVNTFRGVVSDLIDA